MPKSEAKPTSRPSTPHEGGEERPLFGRVLGGKYRIRSFLGGGAMAAVYRAEQIGLSRPVAVKVMHGSLSRHDDVVARFRREAKTASLLSHPSTVSIIDYGEEHDGLLYIVMELVEGRSLQDIVREEAPLAPERIVAIMGQVLSAVAAAHDLKIVHRDLKPENVIVCAGDDETKERVKVCDFGIATILGLDDVRSPSAARSPRGPESTVREITKRFTSVGTVLGTPAYMSPEQAMARDADARSDLYSLGIVLYEMLTGKLPFDAKSSVAMMEAQIYERPIDPFVRSPSCPIGLAIVALRALQKDPAARFVTARAMRTALRRAPETRVFADATSALPPGGGLSPDVWARAANDAGNAPLHMGWSSVEVAEEAPERALPSPPPRGPRQRRNPLAITSILQGVATFVVATALGLAGLVHFSRLEEASAKGAAALANEPVAPPVARDVPAVRPALLPLGEGAPLSAADASTSPDAAAREASYTAKTARVVATVSRSENVGEGDVAALLSRVTFVPCYHTALLAVGRPESARATLHLDIDAEGVVQHTSVSLDGPLASASECLASRVVLLRVARAPETRASADVTLDLVP